MSDSTTLHKAFSADIKVDEGERAVTAIISTSAVDRDGETLVPQGMNSKDFEKNPIVFFGHDYYTLPVGKVVAIKREPDKIVSKVVFASRPETHPVDEEWFPDTVFSLFQQGVLRGFSVGFIVNESRPATDRDIEKYGAGCRRVYSKWTLLELSVAPLPANQDAVSLAVSKGMVSAEVAKAVFDNDTPQPDTVTVDETETPADPNADTATGEPKSVAEVTTADDTASGVHRHVVDGVEVISPAKRLVYFVAAEADNPDPAAIAAKAAERVIQKRRGRIYYV